MHARVTAYKGILVIELLAKQSIEGEVTSNIDNPGTLGTVIHDTEQHLGVSSEALELLKTVKPGHDAVSDVNWFRSNDGKDNFGWMGGPKRLLDPRQAEAARGYAMLSHQVLPNEVPEAAKEAIERSN